MVLQLNNEYTIRRLDNKRLHGIKKLNNQDLVFNN